MGKWLPVPLEKYIRKINSINFLKGSKDPCEEGLALSSFMRLYVWVQAKVWNVVEESQLYGRDLGQITAYQNTSQIKLV